MALKAQGFCARCRDGRFHTGTPAADCSFNAATSLAIAGLSDRARSLSFEDQQQGHALLVLSRPWC